MKARARSVLGLAALAAIPLAFAFNIDGSRWANRTTTFHVGMPGTAPSGQSWSEALAEAMAAWNDATAFTFVANESYVDPCSGYSRNTQSNGQGFPAGNGDGRNSADFRTNVCGNDFGANVLAITLSYMTSGSLGFNYLEQTDIIFDGNRDWDIYSGSPQQTIDFGRVALHELGHVLGLDHELLEPAIMAPSITSLTTLQADDIAGAAAIYDAPIECLVSSLDLNAAVHDSLEAGDCRILDLFNGSSDTSFVDLYRVHLAEASTLNIAMSSSELDAVLIITDPELQGIEIFDDFEGTCDARLVTTLPPGDYLLLANTYVEPDKCAGNLGAYSITITDSAMPVLGTIRNALGGTLLAEALISGGATSDGGATFREAFAANEAFDVLAQIYPDPLHRGLKGRLYVLATLGDGRKFMKDGSGRFVPFAGGLANLTHFRSGTLGALEQIDISKGLKGSTSGLAGQSVAVHVGYALDSKPQEIWYGSSPLRFTIAAP